MRLKKKVRRFFFNKLLSARARRLTPLIIQATEGCTSILDFGCGDMVLMAHLHEHSQKEIVGVDTIDTNLTKLPMVIYDGVTLPFGDKCFDAAAIVYVLHHCQDIDGVLKQLIRVTRKRLVIFEEVYSNPFSRLILTAHDFGNRLLSTKMDIPLNFMKIDKWKEVFARHGLTIARCERVFQYPAFNATSQYCFELIVPE